MARVSRGRRAVINPGIFKAYDIRGKYPAEINEGVVFEIARALGSFFKKGKIVVAHDARLSSKTLYRAIVRGLNHSNVLKNLRIVSVGLGTTPMFYFLVGKLKASGGIIVTASHNPKEYNGLKVVRRGVQMISGKKILKIMTNS